MPNWCSNTLAITGTHEALTEFVDKAFGFPTIYPPTSPHEKPDGPYTEKYLCFNATVPTPQEVIDVGYSRPIRIGRQTGAECTEEPLDGYNWCNLMWGTKWDIYHQHITAEEMGWDADCEELGMYFLTAWSPPVAWVEQLAELFPELNFHLEYEESGSYFAGEVTVEEGCITYRQYTEEECDALFHRDDDDEDDDDDDDTSPEEPLEKT